MPNKIEIFSNISAIFMAVFCFCFFPSNTGAAQASDGDSNSVSSSYAERTINTISVIEKTDNYSIFVSYPYTGNKVLDAELEIWVKRQISTFSHGIDELKNSHKNSIYSMKIDYEINEPSDRCLSVLFRITTDMGGDQPDAGMVSFIYNLPDGRKLTYSDIFRHDEALLNFLSNYSQDTLIKKIGTTSSGSILAGTGLNWLNFEYFALTPSGINIYFPPYQVASYNLGEQVVSIPMKELLPFAPDLSLWKNGDKASTTFSSAQSDSKAKIHGETKNNAGSSASKASSATKAKTAQTPTTVKGKK